MTLLELLELLRKKWYLVLVFPLVFVGATAAYCWGFMTNNYTANVSRSLRADANDKRGRWIRPRDQLRHLGFPAARERPGEDREDVDRDELHRPRHE